MENPLIAVVNTIQLKNPITRDEARTISLSTAPNYQGVVGLIRKSYLLLADGSTAGGIYLCYSPAEAEQMYTESWTDFVREKYGADPTVTYFRTPVVVDCNDRRCLRGNRGVSSRGIQQALGRGQGRAKPNALKLPKHGHTDPL